MRSSEPLWRALEKTPVLTGVRATWVSLLGADITLLQPFLRVRRDVATAYPCPEPDGDGCPRSVVERGPDEFIAVCGASPKRCDLVPLKRTDLAIFEFDLLKLGAHLAAFFGLEGAGVTTQSEGLQRTLHLGAYSPVSGIRFHAYLTLQHEPDDFARVFEILGVRNPDAFILFTPTTSLVAPGVAQAARLRGALIVALSEIIVADDSGPLVLKQSPGEILAPLRDKSVASAELADGMAFFATPPGATWKDVGIRFNDGHKVSVRVLGVEGVYNFTQMGMANGRNGEPTLQWKLLRRFSETRGGLTFAGRHRSSPEQKQRTKLAQQLRAFFRLQGAPFERLGRGSTWRPRFTLRGE